LANGRPVCDDAYWRLVPTTDGEIWQGVELDTKSGTEFRNL
jgi:hypothetical protein